MGRTLRLAATVLLCAAWQPAAAQLGAKPSAPEPPTLTPASAPAAPARPWTSMSHAGVTSALPPQGPMATDLGAPAAAPQPASVPLPPPPVVAGKPVPPAANEPQVRLAADQTGAMVTITQDLESDEIRQGWAAQGGQLPAYEANAGMMIMYKDMAKEAGAGAYMSGFGINGGVRLSILNLTPPKYETRDRGWTAFKVGGGVDLGVMGVTITTPVTCFPPPVGGCIGGTQSASMSSFTLVGTVGFMRAFGSFDSPRDWSGFAIGAEWAPSYQSTTLTMSDGKTPPQTSSSMNATGFALNFESGSMQAMAMKMAKKARLKVRLFVLPAVGDLPFLMTASVGAVWY